MPNTEPNTEPTSEPASRLPARTAFTASGLAALLTWAAHFPLDWGVLGWLAPVPLVILIRLPTPPRWLLRTVYLTTLLGTTASLQWMRLGDTWMIPAWLSLAIYLSLYTPLLIAVTRTAVHRFHVPIGLAVPVAWVATEYARAHIMTGLAWYFLAHTQYRFIELIQISDLVGAYGVTALVALAATALALAVPTRWLNSCGWWLAEDPTPRHFATRQTVLTTTAAVTLIGLALAYGLYRRGQSQFTPGPRVALVQGNFTSSLKNDPDAFDNIYRIHRRLTGLAVREQPDIIVWPETMFRYPLLEMVDTLDDEQLRTLAPGIPPGEWRNNAVRELLADLAAESGAGLIVGLERLVAGSTSMKAFNSAVHVRPDTGIASRYDKIHRVPFGEYVPLADSLPWLHRLTPFPASFGISAGNSATIFNHQDWQLAPLICFEDTVPHLVREIVASAKAKDRSPDLLVNLTNDGWFHGSSELDQHLVTAIFRCVECRTPMVRAVNTGISAIIDGDGVIRIPETFIDGDAEIALELAARDPSLDESERGLRIEQIETHRRRDYLDPMTGRWQRQLNAVLVDVVPLDSRQSLYVQTGDWFAGSCTLASLMILLAGLIGRWKQRRTRTYPTSIQTPSNTPAA
jgi:apolipoprotein N-acyltransferase